MLFILFFFSHYAAVAAIAFLALGAGRKLVGAVSWDSAWEEVSFSTAIGLGLIAYIVFALALLHILYKGVVLAVLVLLAVLACRPLAELGARSWQCCKSLNHKWLLAIVAGLLFFPVLVLPLYPPSTWDALMYHLPVAKLDVQAHSLVFSPNIRFPAFPETVEMLFSLMLLLFDDVSAQLVHFLMMFLVAITLFAWGKRIHSSTAGLWAAAIWLSNPFVLFFGSVAYIDMGVTLFVCLGAYAFSNWMQTREKRWLLISGVVFGLGAACKYSALAPLCGFLGVLLYLSIRKREVRPFAMFAIAVALVAAPWYLRNIYYTRNPVWPYFGSVFGYGPWSATDLQGLIHNQQTDYSQGRSLGLLLRLPWDLSFRMLKVFRQEAPTPLSPVYFFCLPVALLYAIRNRYARALLVGMCLFTLFWFFSIQIVRFLLPAVAVLGLLAMTGLAYLACSVRHLNATPRPWLSLTVALLLMLPGLKFSLGFWRQHLLPVTAAQRAAYLRGELPPFPAYEWLNRSFGRNYVIYAPGDQKMTYYADGQFLGDWFGPAGCMRVISKLSDSRALYQQLLAFNADFFLLNEHDFRPQVLHGLPWAEDDFFRSHFRLVWAAPYIQLFEVVRGEIKPVANSELIQDASFEENTASSPERWMVVGHPRVDDSGTRSHSGRTAIQLSGSDRLLQRIPVNPCHMYRLSEWTEGEAPGASSRLQINWIPDGRSSLTDFEVVSNSPAWLRHEMFTIAPPHTTLAEIQLQAQNASVWIDDVSVVELAYANDGTNSATRLSNVVLPCR